MRKAFFDTLQELMAADHRVTLVTGDMGFGLAEPIRDRFPNQYVNAGIAEQAMTGLAAGLALSGRVAFTYSIANFPTLRCLEQIRNDVCYHEANVKIASVGAGLAYGQLGSTHHAGEDLAIMRSLPNMTVIAPGDPAESAHATRAAVELDGPVYLRVGRGGEPRVHESDDIPFKIGKAIRVRAGTDAAIFSTGSMLVPAVEASDALRAEGIEVGVYSFHTLKPLDTRTIVEVAGGVRALLTMEEHSILGGLGGAVSETLAESGLSLLPAFQRIGMPSAFAKVVGTQALLRERFGLTASHATARLRELLDPKRVSIRTTVVPTERTSP